MATQTDVVDLPTANIVNTDWRFIFSANASAFQCLLTKSFLEVQLWYSGEMSLNLEQEIWPFPLICYFIKQGSTH